jgi:hypothetical protein
MLLGKNVRVRMNNFTLGQVTFGGVDASGQMLRDGAAWFDLSDKDNQSVSDTENYLALENAAKQEKRGVWGVEGLKPSWEFRAEQEKAKTMQAQKLAEEAAAAASRQKAAVQKPQLTAEERSARRNAGVQIWADLGANDKDKKNTINAATNSTSKISDVADSEMKNPSEKPISAKYAKITENLEYLQNFIVTFEDKGYQTKEYTAEFNAISRKIKVDIDSLPQSRIKTLIRENLDTLADLGYVWKTTADSNHDFVDYKGEGKIIADKYKIKPIRNKRGDFIFKRQQILDSLAGKVARNLKEVKKTAAEQI